MIDQTFTTVPMSSLPSSNSSRSRRASSNSPRVSSDRRQRARLRDLCDEVLASFRVASNNDPISEQDRALAGQILPRVARLV